MRLRNPKGKGIRFERAVRKFLRSEGYHVVRQAASCFPDIIATKDGVHYAIECKTNGYLSPEEKLALWLLKVTYGYFPVVSYKIRGCKDPMFSAPGGSAVSDLPSCALSRVEQVRGEPVL